MDPENGPRSVGPAAYGIERGLCVALVVGSLLLLSTGIADAGGACANCKRRDLGWSCSWETRDGGTACKLLRNSCSVSGGCDVSQTSGSFNVSLGAAYYFGVSIPLQSHEVRRISAPVYDWIDRGPAELGPSIARLLGVADAEVRLVDYSFSVARLDDEFEIVPAVGTEDVLVETLRKASGRDTVVRVSVGNGSRFERSSSYEIRPSGGVVLIPLEIDGMPVIQVLKERQLAMDRWLEGQDEIYDRFLRELRPVLVGEGLGLFFQDAPTGMVAEILD